MAWGRDLVELLDPGHWLWHWLWPCLCPELIAGSFKGPLFSMCHVTSGTSRIMYRLLHQRVTKGSVYSLARHCLAMDNQYIIMNGKLLRGLLITQ